MRSEKGITLTSLIIYVIVLTFVIGTMSTLSGYFVKGLKQTQISVDTPESYTRFTTFINNDMNSDKFVDVIDNGDNDITIEFSDGTSHTYIYRNNKIYYIVQNEDDVVKKITLCSEITYFNCEYEDESNLLKISLTANEITYNNNFYVKS